MVRNLEFWFKPELIRWQTGSVVFDDGATLFHNYPLCEPAFCRSVRVYGSSAVMSDYEIEVFGEDIGPSGRITAEREWTTSGTLKSISVQVPGTGLVRWENSFADHRFSDEQIAVATVLSAMSRAVLDGKPPIYTCEDFLTDIEIVQAFDFSAIRGGARIPLPLNETRQKVRLLTNSNYWKKRLSDFNDLFSKGPVAEPR